MATAIEQYPAGVPDETASRAADHLWMHFARQGRHPEVPVPVVTRGKVVTTRWLDPSHGGINLGFPQNI